MIPSPTQAQLSLSRHPTLDPEKRQDELTVHPEERLQEQKLSQQQRGIGSGKSSRNDHYPVSISATATETTTRTNTTACDHHLLEQYF
jgi:hypothetical protein